MQTLTSWVAHTLAMCGSAPVLAAQRRHGGRMSLMKVSGTGKGAASEGAGAGCCMVAQFGQGVEQRCRRVAGERGEPVQASWVVIDDIGDLVNGVEAEPVRGGQTGQ